MYLYVCCFNLRVVGSLFIARCGGPGSSVSSQVRAPCTRGCSVWLGDFYWFQAFLGPGVGTVAASAWLSALQIGIFRVQKWGTFKKVKHRTLPPTHLYTPKSIFLEFILTIFDSLTPDSCSA